MPIFKDNPGEEANSWFSMWCMPMFHFPNLPQLLKIDHFTEQTIQRIEKPAGERSSSKHPTNQQQRTAVLASVF